MSSFVRYTVLRLLAFAVCLLVLSAIPWMRDNVLVLVLVAATASMLISLFFLNGPRQEMAEQLAERAEHRHEHRAAHADPQDTTHRRRGRGGARAATDEDIEDAEIAQDVEHYR